MKIGTLQKIRGKFAKDELIKTPRQLEKCKKYLAGLPEPKDEIERSYNQFLTQRFFQHNILLNCAEAVCSKMLLNRRMREFGNNKPVFLRKADAVFSNRIGTSIIPDEVKELFPDLAIDDGQDNLVLTAQDCEFIGEIKKRHKNSYFLYKTVHRIAVYRNLIERYHPQAVIATSEYSFCSSILTKFCRINGVRHINVMHGEKLFDMTSTFFVFDKCYVWNRHYVDLFETQRADPSQFAIAVPASLKFNRGERHIDADLRVYLSNETKKELKSLSANLKLLKTNPEFSKIVVRPHPLYTKKENAEEIFSDVCEIEAPESCKIEESIMKSKWVMARFSTVLQQAAANDVNIIIDDCTSPELFGMLRLLNYKIIDEKNVRLFSELLEIAK